VARVLNCLLGHVHVRKNIVAPNTGLTYYVFIENVGRIWLKKNLLIIVFYR
jgi:hypothetical protein